MNNKVINKRLIVKALIVVMVISGLLLAIYFGRVRCALFSNDEAVRIANDFCKKHHFECIGDPEIGYYTNVRPWSNLKCRPAHHLYNKVIKYDTGEIQIGCRSKKVISAAAKLGKDNPLKEKAHATLEDQYDYFRKILSEMNILKCSFVTGYKYFPESGSQNIGMYSIVKIKKDTEILNKFQMLSRTERLRLLNTGSLSLEPASKRMILDLANPSDCDGYELADPFNVHISLIEASKIAWDTFNKEGTYLRINSSNYLLREISLGDNQRGKSYNILDKTWIATFERKDNDRSLPKYYKVWINALNGKVMFKKKGTVLFNLN